MKTAVREEPFFIFMAMACFAYAVIGFGPGFVKGLQAGFHTIPFRIHLHGLVMMSWLGLAILQPTLISAGQFKLHRLTGCMGLLLFLLVWLLGLSFALNNIVIPLPPAIETLLNRIFAFQVIFFLLGPLVLWLALASLPDTQAHRRYMLILTLLMIEAATSRMNFLPGVAGPDSNVVLLQLYPTLLVIPLIAHDLSKLGRLHAATMIGGGLLLAGRLLGILLWYNSSWDQSIHGLGQLVSESWSGFSDN